MNLMERIDKYAKVKIKIITFVMVLWFASGLAIMFFIADVIEAIFSYDPLLYVVVMVFVTFGMGALNGSLYGMCLKRRRFYKIMRTSISYILSGLECNDKNKDDWYYSTVLVYAFKNLMHNTREDLNYIIAGLPLYWWTTMGEFNTETGIESHKILFSGNKVDVYKIESGQQKRLGGRRFLNTQYGWRKIMKEVIELVEAL